MLLTVVTAALLLGHLLARRGETVRTVQGEIAPCWPGQSTGDVEGMATITVAPQVSTASAARP